MDRNSLQYKALRQRLENTERQMQQLYTLLYSLSLEVTKLRNSHSDTESKPVKTNTKKQSEPLPSRYEEPSDAINRLLAATRN